MGSVIADCEAGQDHPTTETIEAEPDKALALSTRLVLPSSGTNLEEDVNRVIRLLAV